MRLRNEALRAEWRSIRTHRILLVSIIVMLLIPIMYGGFFLGSIWDPYGNTSHLPVAIVNDDEGAELDGKVLHIGDDLIDNLKSNHDMGWQFVSADQARKGIDDGTYYMSLTIPKDFSQHATSVSSTNPTKSTVKYTLTPARNYVASLLTKQAAQQIAQTVSTNISKAYIAAIFEHIATLQSGMKEAASGAASLSTGSQSVSNGINSYTAGVSQLQAGQVSLDAGIIEISSGSQSLKSGLVSLSGGLPSSSEISQMKTGILSIQQGLSSLYAAVQHPDATLVAQQNLVMADATSLQQKLVSYESAMTTAQSSIGALQTAIASSQTTAVVNAQDMLTVVGTSGDVASQSASLLTHLSTLTTMLASQQSTLATSVGSLNTGMMTLAPSLTMSLDGFTTISQGTSQLLGGATRLSAGSTTALSGSQQLVAGSAKLTASSAALVDGAAQVASGSAQLSTALSDASSQLALQPTSEATVEQIASPVTTSKTEKGDVPNYGYALSPYVLSLGLFVGALVFNVIYPVRRFFTKPKNAWSWWVAKMSIAGAVAVGQALVLGAIMVYGLGLHPDNPGQFALLSIVTSLTYMSIVTLLAIALDNVGRFIAMLLLVLQLGSAEGVFPIVLSPAFFQAVHPFVPMTYSIYAYREAISSGVGSNVYWSNLAVLIAITIGANALMVLFFRIHGMRHFRHESIDDAQ